MTIAELINKRSQATDTSNHIRIYTKSCYVSGGTFTVYEGNFQNIPDSLTYCRVLFAEEHYFDPNYSCSLTAFISDPEVDIVMLSGGGTCSTFMTCQNVKQAEEIFDYYDGHYVDENGFDWLLAIDYPDIDF